MDRIKIVAGTRKIGDTLNGRKITGFGKTWNQRVTDDSACAYGMEPGLDYYPDVTLQYAYLGSAVQS
jgi:hypothetical protein